MRLSKLFTVTRANFLRLLAGNAVSKLILAAGGVLLAKYYGPERYGFYNIFVSYVLIVSMISSLRLENIIVLTDKEKAARNIFYSILVAGVVVISVLFAGIAFADIPFLKKANWNAGVYIVCSLSCLFTLANNAFTELFTRLDRFRTLAAGTALGSFLTILFQLVFLLTGLKDLGLPVGMALATFITVIYFSAKDGFRFSIPDFKFLKRSVAAHPGIIRYTFLSDIINNIANNSLPILVSGYFNQREVGVFSMAMKITSIPLLVIYQSASRVFFTKALNLYNNAPADLYGFTRKVSGINLLLSFLFVVIINTIGAYMLSLYFGASWSNINSYIWILSFWILSRSTVTAISPVIMVIQKNHYALLFNIYFLIITFLSFYLGSLAGSLLRAVYLFSFLSGAGYLVLLLFVMRALKHYKNGKK